MNEQNSREVTIMKRLIMLCFSVIVLLINTVPALAAGTVAVLSAEDVSITDNTLLVPVNISDNPGIMGFKVTASYSPDLLEISNATAGSVTTKGSFIHNAGKASGQVDIIWYSTEQTVDNGSLFVLTVKPTDGFIENESTKITLSFSQADTFNEKYEDVAFNCKPINVSYDKGSEQTPISSEPSKNTATEAANAIAPATSPKQTQETDVEVPVTDEQIIGAVDAALGNTETGSIDDVDSETLDEVNENLQTIAGPNAPQFSSTEELKERYKTAKKNEYSEQAKTNLDASVISSILKDILDIRNASSFSELSESEKASAVAEAYRELHEADDTLPDISNILNVDESVEMFDGLISDVATEDEEDRTKKTDNEGFLVFVVVIAAIVICSLVIFVLYKKKKKSIVQEAIDSKEKE